jgi:nucleotide-binding universal stress UspA family protein
VSTIIYATDFPQSVGDTLELAVEWARRAKARLVVVSVLDEAHATRERISQRHDGLTARVGGQADVDIRVGHVADELVHAVAELQASALLLGPADASSSSSPGSRTVLESVAVRCSAPVVALRPEVGAWLRGERSLRVLVGVDLSLPSDAAVQWSLGLQAMGPCEVVLAHLYSHSDAVARLTPLGLTAEAEVESMLRREVIRRAGVELPVMLDSDDRAPARRLLSVAAADKFDLVVIGARRHTGLDRLIHGSAVHGLVARADRPVAFVPAVVGTLAAPRIRTVLFPTDFTAASLAALPQARALLADGGTLVLLHVSEEVYEAGRDERHQRIRERLQELQPHDPGMMVRTQVVDAYNVAKAILAVADQQAADLICLGTRGRTIGTVFLGSVAALVAGGAHRPVLLVPPGT